MEMRLCLATQQDCSLQTDTLTLLKIARVQHSSLDSRQVGNSETTDRSSSLIGEKLNDYSGPLGRAKKEISTGHAGPGKLKCRQLFP